jgi:uncharacterized protein (TIGR00725 family)
VGQAGIVDKRRIVAVVGSGADLRTEERSAPFQLGRWLAGMGWHLLTGGGGGVMEAAAEGFCSVNRDGLAIGIIPAGKPGGRYPNPWIELAIRTHLVGADPKGHDSRNHINILTCDVLVIFPGGSGTRAEVELALGRRPLSPMAACLRASETVGGLDRASLVAAGIEVRENVQDVIGWLATTTGISE